MMSRSLLIQCPLYVLLGKVDRPNPRWYVDAAGHTLDSVPVAFFGNVQGTGQTILKSC